MVLLHGQLEVAKAREVTEGLSARVEEVRKQLAEERLLNDKNAARLKELECILDALEDASAFVKASAPPEPA
jgi:hypothetical protein